MQLLDAPCQMPRSDVKPDKEAFTSPDGYALCQPGCCTDHGRLDRSQTPQMQSVGTHPDLLAEYRAEHPATEDLNVSERVRLKEIDKENWDSGWNAKSLKRRPPSSPRNSESEIRAHCR